MIARYLLLSAALLATPLSASETAGLQSAYQQAAQFFYPKVRPLVSNAELPFYWQQQGYWFSRQESAGRYLYFADSLQQTPQQHQHRELPLLVMQPADDLGQQVVGGQGLDGFARRDRQGHAVQRDHGAEELGDVFELKDVVAHKNWLGGLTTTCSKAGADVVVEQHGDQEHEAQEDAVPVVVDAGVANADLHHAENQRAKCSTDY